MLLETAIEKIRALEFDMANILLIDDDDEFRPLLHAALKSKRHTVYEANNGVAGLKSLRSHPTDLVLCDIMMPDKDGLETVRDIRRLYRDLKIVSMSATEPVHGVDYLEFAKEFGADATIKKPFKIKAFIELVESVLAKPCSSSSQPDPE